MNDADSKKRKPLTLKSSNAGVVRQSFSGGRSRSVVVEKKKRRAIVVPGQPGAQTTKPEVERDEVAEAAKKLGLSRSEYIKRQKALDEAAARQSEREAVKKAEEVERQRRMEEEQRALDQKKEGLRALEERKKAEERERRKQEDAEAARRAPTVAQKILAEDDDAKDDLSMLEKAGGRIKKQRSGGGGKSSRALKGESRRRKGKLTIVSALAGDNERQRSLASMRRAREKEKQRQQQGGDRLKVARDVTIPEAITVADLANRMAERGADVVKYLMKQGTMATLNDVLDADTAQLVAEDFGHNVKRVAAADVEENFIKDDLEEDAGKQKPRAPVIAVMGHVDHGKTSLLDALRSADVASGEAGGITQHIGAYQLELKTGKRITVLDTPGHAAFSAMRTRGAQAVDIVILVVAADDGVRPQTIESIAHAKAADTPIIVAINKIDTYEADADKVETELLQHEIITESLSGDVQSVHVSALKKTGLDDLAEAISLQAELINLKADPKREADGLVIESQIEKGRGPVATLLVKRGTLKQGDIVVAGQYWGKVKAMMDERSGQLEFAGPSVPVAVMGFDGAPAPGEPFAAVADEARAREITAYRRQKAKEASIAKPSALASTEQMMAKLADSKVGELPLIVKADVQGSVEAIRSSVGGAGNDEVKVNIIHGAVGAISESDVLLAKTSEATILAFNVRPNRQARDLAEQEGVDIRYYSVIYDLIDDVKGVLAGMLKPERRETFIGYAEILEVFNISRVGKVAGCRVTEGRVERGSGVRLLRDNVVIHEGMLSTLKRFKDEVEKVQAGMECGMAFENYEDIHKSDQIECFTVEMVERAMD
ncbi:MAG: translation initiation factor IF-2 [Hyphomonadaceae bacterium]|nr:translation initiation factor IF-2 [Hyphomonadaceae bacterium]MBC6412813.1 translation initiation factor IF-2 [Hyphomonadaceae bacterium]